MVIRHFINRTQIEQNKSAPKKTIIYINVLNLRLIEEHVSARVFNRNLYAWYTANS